MQLSYFPACGAEPPRESALLPPRPEFGRVGTSVICERDWHSGLVYKKGASIQN